MSRRLLQIAASAGAAGSAALFAFKMYRDSNAEDVDRFPEVGKNTVYPDREEQIEKMKTETFDFLVIGGGATGAGVALDVASRGLSCALVEAADFSAGTSSRSTKLIHGGVRYLETAFKKLDYGQYELVDEALHERSHMMRSAPFMAHALPLMIPIYTWWEIPYMYAGVKLYDFIAGNKAHGLPPAHYVQKDVALQQFPMLKAEGLKGAIVYYDGQMNDSRMNLHLILTSAVQNYIQGMKGAAVANYVEVIHLLKDADNQKLIGAKVRDKISGKVFDIKAKVVVNATGPFADTIRKMDDPTAENLIVPSAGVHIVVPDYYSPQGMGLLIPKTKDGRVLFFLPWEQNTLVGTTDAESDVTLLPKPTADDVNFIVEESCRFLKKDAVQMRSDVRAAWSGIRPLAKDPHAAKLLRIDSQRKQEEKAAQQSGTPAQQTAVPATAKISRKHEIEVSDSGLVSVLGGKWTIYRRMAYDAVNEALKRNPSIQPAYSCRTTNLILLGTKDFTNRFPHREINFYNNEVMVHLRNEFQLSKDSASHLTQNYGLRALEVAQLGSSKNLLNPLVRMHPFIEAEVLYAVEKEYARAATDVLARRLRLAFIDAEAAQQALPRVIAIMGDALKWSRERREKERKEALVFLDTMRSPLASA